MTPIPFAFSQWLQRLIAKKFHEAICKLLLTALSLQYEGLV